MKSMSGEEVARELISVLSVTLSVESHRLLAVMRDRASVNTAAMRVVTIIYPCCHDHLPQSAGRRVPYTSFTRVP